MAVYEPPNNYFNNINFNTDFYTIPNDELDGISAAYANTHYLQTSAGTTPKSQAISSIFAGTISENNILLSTKYQSNLYASLNYLSKQYPPISLTVYGANTISGQTYGNGSYNVTNSSSLGGYEANYAFNYPYTPNTVVWMSGNAYTVSTGIYNGATSTTVLSPISSNILGEWVQLQIPSALVLKNYIITGISGGGNIRCPVSWILAGSINGSTWYVLDSRSGITWASGSNQAYSLSPNNITYNTTVYNYYRIISIQTGGGAWASFNQLLLNFYDPADASFAAISTGGIGIGTNSLANPMTLYNSGTSRLNGYVGINTNPSTLYGLDVKSFSGVRVQHETAGNGMAVLGPASNATSAGAIYLYNGTPSIVGIVGGGNLYIPNYLDLIVNSPYLGWSINSNLAINGNCGIGTNPSATFGLDVRSSSGLRVQHTTAGGTVTLIGSTSTSSLGSIVFNDGFSINGSIGGALVSGSYINMNTVFGITSGFSMNGNLLASAVGIGTIPAAARSLAINTTSAGSAAISIYGPSANISMNTDKIRIGYANTAGLFALNSVIDDCVMVNSNGRFLLNPSASPYAPVAISSANGGTTRFMNIADGTNFAVIDNYGITCALNITANSALTGQSITISGTGLANSINGGVTFNNSLTITGGVPLTLASSINAAAGALTGNNVTAVPAGYIYWGGGNGTGVTAYSAPSLTAYSIRANNAIVGNGFISSSDKRIKRDIKLIENSLEIVEKIEPKNYNMIESAENRYGFIAQEVEEVIPNAVILSYDFIPNIFDFGDYDDKVITFDNKNNLDIAEGDEIKINNDNYIIKEVIDKNTFKIDKELEVDETKKVFITGTQVKDFKSINYDMITSINTAAIKELYSIIKQQQQQIAFLLTKLS